MADTIKIFQDVLKKYRSLSFSERDKGARFERLAQAFLKTYPPYEGLLRISDPSPMRKVVAFCQNIQVSPKITKMFNDYKGDY